MGLRPPAHLRSFIEKIEHELSLPQKMETSMAYGIQLILIVRPANSPAKIVTEEITTTGSSARQDFYEALQNDDLQRLETSENGIQVDHKIFASAKIDEIFVNGREIDASTRLALKNVKENILTAEIAGHQVETFIELY
jgi:hypothetical protein